MIYEVCLSVLLPSVCGTLLSPAAHISYLSFGATKYDTLSLLHQLLHPAHVLLMQFSRLTLQSRHLLQCLVQYLGVVWGLIVGMCNCSGLLSGSAFLHERLES